MTKHRHSFTPKFKLEGASPLDHGHSHIEAARSPGLIESALCRWVKQLHEGGPGVTPKSKALTPEQQILQQLGSQDRPTGTGENDPKKATALKS